MKNVRETNKIMLERRGGLYFPEYNAKEDAIPSMKIVQVIFTWLDNIESLGYTVTYEDVIKLSKFDDVDVLKAFLNEVTPVVIEFAGADKTYTPVYAGFPEEVRDADESILFINAIWYYITGHYPNREETPKMLPLPYVGDLKELKVYTERDDYLEIFTNLMGANTSISESDKELIKYFFDNEYQPGEFAFPEMGFKENIAVVTKLYMRKSGDTGFNARDIKSWFNTATDVLRLYVALSDGDVSLATNTKFINLKKKEVRLLLDLLRQMDNLEEEMAKYKEQWKRVGERIHPGVYNPKKYAKVQDAFEAIRSGKKIRNWQGEVDALTRNSDWERATEKYKGRPGIFARNLDYLLRNREDKANIVKEFRTVASEVSTPVLLQLMKHFEFRNVMDEKRVVLPKGNVQKMHLLERNTEVIPESICKAIVTLCKRTLEDRFSEMDFLGNVYIDDTLKGYLIPSSQRSASEMKRPITRGSRVHLKDSTKTIRLFTWWTNAEDNSTYVDVDLSAIILDDDLKNKGELTYYSLKRDKVGVHSGDWTDGGKFGGDGVSEFIDVSIEGVLAKGGRYIAVTNQLYSGGKFGGFPCQGGVMEFETDAMNPPKEFTTQDRPGDNLTNKFSPERTTILSDIASCPSSTKVSLVVDCKERCIIWADLAGRLESYSGSNVNNTMPGILKGVYSCIHMHKTSLYELLEMHANARGVLVDNAEDADISFGAGSAYTYSPFDIDVFMNEYLK